MLNLQQVSCDCKTFRHVLMHALGAQHDQYALQEGQAGVARLKNSSPARGTLLSEVINEGQPGRLFRAQAAVAVGAAAAALLQLARYVARLGPPAPPAAPTAGRLPAPALSWSAAVAAPRRPRALLVLLRLRLCIPLLPCTARCCNSLTHRRDMIRHTSTQQLLRPLQNLLFKVGAPKATNLGEMMQLSGQTYKHC